MLLLLRCPHYLVRPLPPICGQNLCATSQLKNVNAPAAPLPHPIYYSQSKSPNIPVRMSFEKFVKLISCKKKRGPKELKSGSPPPPPSQNAIKLGILSGKANFGGKGQIGGRVVTQSGKKAVFDNYLGNKPGLRRFLAYVFGPVTF